jgi:hypothetical protein
LVFRALTLERELLPDLLAAGADLPAEETEAAEQARAAQTTKPG